MNVNKRKIFLVLFLFGFIYAPPIFPFNFMYITAIYSWFMLIVKYRKAVKKLLIKKNVGYFNIGLCLLFIYYLFLIIINVSFGESVEIGNYINTIYRFFSIFFIIEPTVLYILLYCKNNKMSINDLIEGLIYGALIEFILCIACVISPSIKITLNTIMFSNANSQNIGELASWTYNARYYGFAEVMIDLFGYGSGLIAGICLLYGYYKKKEFLKYFPLLVFMTCINSITGLLIILIAGILIIFESKITKQKLWMLLVAPVLFVIFMFIYAKVAPGSFDRIINNFWVLVDSSEVTHAVTSLEVLFSDRFWQLPSKTGHIIFGTGHSVYGTEYYTHSDVGYINNIWLFGIVGTISLYFFYWKLLLTNKNTYSKLYKNITYFMLFSLMFFEIKGIGIGCNPGNSVLILLAISIYFLKDYNYTNNFKVD